MNPLDTIRANIRLIGIIAGGIVLTALIAWCLIVTGQRNDARRDLEAEKAAYAATVANYRAATEKARADDLANKAAVENRYATIQKEQSLALSEKLAAARADANRFAARLRAQAGADRGSQRIARVSESAAAASGTVAADAQAIVDADLAIAAENTVKAEAWREWWLSVSK